ncbi:MAG: 16S rRNA (guanine(527)-N(7))-methyltransferase RsmG, partial [Christensenellales bacterium]
NMINEELKQKNENTLCDVLNRLNISPTKQMLEQFYIYFEYLIEYNNNVNLTAITDMEDVYLKHFADSMLGAKYIKTGASVCDIGTGAGFPGVVLKIIRPDIKLVLVDSLNKRVDFLKNLLNKLQLFDVQVFHNRAEDVDFKNKFLNSFDCVVSRAVAKLNTLCEYCLPYVKPDGCFIAYKSADIKEEINVARNCISILGGEIKNTETVFLDATTERNFVIIAKKNNTSSKFPRGQNKPRLKPL